MDYLINIYHAGQEFFNKNSGWLTFISLAIALFNIIISKIYLSIKKKPLKNSWVLNMPLLVMFIMSVLILFSLLNSKNVVDPAMIAVISANTVVVVFLILAFLLGNQKINAVHFAKAKYGLFEINHLDE